MADDQNCRLELETEALGITNCLLRNELDRVIRKKPSQWSNVKKGSNDERLLSTRLTYLQRLLEFMEPWFKLAEVIEGVVCNLECNRC